jgi:hypothetical protein
LIDALILPESDMIIAGDPVDRYEIEAAVDRARADVVIVGGQDGEASPPDAATYAELLYRHPRLRMVLIDGGIQRAVLYALAPTLTPIGELSPTTLLAAIRGGAGNAQPASAAD